MRAEDLDLLECPQCHGELIWTVTERAGDRVEAATARCAACAAEYAVRDGIGLFLAPDLPRDDTWEEADSHLSRYLREHPEQERALLDGPLTALAPADQFYRALALEARADFVAAQTAAEKARRGLYTAEYLACAEDHIAALLDKVPPGPLVDLASGRGTLVERLARQGCGPILATDFSPRVLAQTRRRMRFLGLDAPITYLACDARRTPFKPGAVALLTTYLGLCNMTDGATVVAELRRIVRGRFLAIVQGYPEQDVTNTAALRAAGLESVLILRELVALLGAAGWDVEVARHCTALARPTSTSAILDGARIDGLPVAPATITWALLAAS